MRQRISSGTAVLTVTLIALSVATLLSMLNKTGEKALTYGEQHFQMERYLFKSQPLYRRTLSGFIRSEKWVKPGHYCTIKRLNHKAGTDFLQLKIDPRYWIKEAYTSAASRVQSGNTLKIGLERVDRWYALGPDYRPGDLIQLPMKYCKFRSVKMRKSAARAFIRLVKAAASEGIQIHAFSGFRSFSVQRLLYLRRIGIGRKLKQQAVARPGHSEHQLGTTVDVVGPNSALAAKSAFARTPEAKWLRRRCYDFGFVLSYGPDNKIPTGYITESWHIRYIGKQNIKAWKKAHFRGASLE